MKHIKVFFVEKFQQQLSKLTITVSKSNNQKITNICQKGSVFSLE